MDRVFARNSMSLNRKQELQMTDFLFTPRTGRKSTPLFRADPFFTLAPLSADISNRSKFFWSLDASH